MTGEARGVPGLDPVREPDGSQADRRSHDGSNGAKSAGRGGATYAALDLGTNNCRLLVARPTSESFRVIDAFSRIIRLGEGISTSGVISEAAIGRAIEALSVCRDKMKNRNVGRARLIATEACRSAGNGEDFRSRVVAATGLELEIIDRETEATLAATGCTPLVDPDSEGVVLFDIGGGSSELVRLERSQRNGGGPAPPKMRGWISLPHGVVTLAEKYGGHEVSAATFDAMIDEISLALTPFVEAYGSDVGGIHLLGTSGTVTTIAGVHLELRRYERSRVDGCWMIASEIETVIDRLLAMSYAERAASPCIGPERADLVLAGCAILQAIRKAFPVPRLRVADRGLREGMLVQMMREDGVWAGR